MQQGPTVQQGPENISPLSSLHSELSNCGMSDCGQQAWWTEDTERQEERASTTQQSWSDRRHSQATQEQSEREGRSDKQHFPESSEHSLSKPSTPCTGKQAQSSHVTYSRPSRQAGIWPCGPWELIFDKVTGVRPL